MAWTSCDYYGLRQKAKDKITQLTYSPLTLSKLIIWLSYQSTVTAPLVVAFKSRESYRVLYYVYKFAIIKLFDRIIVIVYGKWDGLCHGILDETNCLWWHTAKFYIKSYIECLNLSERALNYVVGWLDLCNVIPISIKKNKTLHSAPHVQMYAWQVMCWYNVRRSSI